MYLIDLSIPGVVIRCFIFRSTEAVTRGALKKMVFLEISQNSQENTCVRVSQVLTFIKKDTLAQAFSRRFCEISKKTFITEHLQTAIPEVAVRRYA